MSWYAPIEPYESSYLAVDGGHSLYWEACGNPRGLPALFLHSGPGGGCTANNRRLFDPDRYRIILFDQRGCDRSRPHASLEANTTAHLVSDIDTLRCWLGVERWLLLGGSWGAALALAYAETWPERVSAMILRGVFTARRSEFAWLYEEGGASRVCPEAWQRFQAPIPEAERGDLIGGYHARLTSGDPAVEQEAARAWCAWEDELISYAWPSPPRSSNSFQNEYLRLLPLARIEAHYALHRAFLEEGQLLANAHRLDGIPGVIVQGGRDAVTPPRAALDLHAAWPHGELRIVKDGGHASCEPGILGELVRATDAFARRSGPGRASVRSRAVDGSGFVAAAMMTLFLWSGATAARSQSPEHAGHALGKVDFPVSCTAAAQSQLNRAVALLHHMTYPQAREAFQQVAEIDPGCAMAHWGIASTLFQPLWPTRPGAEDLQRGWEAVQRAKALQPPTERERLFLAAAEAFFREPTSPDYWQRITRWEQAMERVHSSFPQDHEAAAFYALAHLAVAPSNAVSLAHSERAAKLLLPVYEQNPDHPGAMHYLVHANDVPGRERESLEIIRKYEAVAPRNPHALHMPTHIYTRLGDWDAVIRGNLRAAEAALLYPAGDRAQFIWDEFPHAIEYLVYAYLQKGAHDDSAAQLKRLQGAGRLEPSFKTAFHLASVPARHALERRAWSEAASLIPREHPALDWGRFMWPEAVTWFARGLGAARIGGIEEAGRAVKRLEDLESAASKAGEDLFTRHIRVLRLAVSAWLAQLTQARQAAVSLMRQAAELEASTPKHAVTPAPTLPAYELLGDLLLEQRNPTEALAAYKRSLQLYPRRFNGLLGAARAARALGEQSLAGTFYRELLEVAAGGTRQPAIEEARSFVARQR